VVSLSETHYELYNNKINYQITLLRYVKILRISFLSYSMYIYIYIYIYIYLYIYTVGVCMCICTATCICVSISSQVLLWTLWLNWLNEYQDLPPTQISPFFLCLLILQKPTICKLTDGKKYFPFVLCVSTFCSKLQSQSCYPLERR